MLYMPGWCRAPLYGICHMTYRLPLEFAGCNSKLGGRWHVVQVAGPPPWNDVPKMLLSLLLSCPAGGLHQQSSHGTGASCCLCPWSTHGAAGWHWSWGGHAASGGSLLPATSCTGTSALFCGLQRGTCRLHMQCPGGHLLESTGCTCPILRVATWGVLRWGLCWMQDLHPRWGFQGIVPDSCLRPKLGVSRCPCTCLTSCLVVSWAAQTNHLYR